MRGDLIEARTELEEAFSTPLFLLFKHSPLCPTSARAFAEYTAFLQENPLESGWIHVVQGRPLALLVAERTGVPHESPQALFLQAGRVLWHASHAGVTASALEEALRAARAQSGS